MPKPQTLSDRLTAQAAREANHRERDLKQRPWFTCLACHTPVHYRDHHWCGATNAQTPQ